MEEIKYNLINVLYTHVLNKMTILFKCPIWLTGLKVGSAFPEGISFKNVKLSYLQGDFRPSVVTDDVKGFTVNTLSIPSMLQLPVMVLHNTTDTSFQKIQIPINADKGIWVQK